MSDLDQTRRDNVERQIPGSKHIPLDQLRSAPEYQRELDHNRVDWIARHFDVNQLGVFEVSQRKDGNYYVIDGNHRFQALLILGWSVIQVPCVVHRHLSIAQEAELFRLLNTHRRRPEAYDLYRAGLVANDQKLIDIDTIIREVGLVAAPKRSVDPKALKAIKPVEEIYNFHGADMLRRVLTVVSQSWPHDHLNGLSAKMIDAITAFIVTHASQGRTIDDRALIHGCSHLDPARFVASGNASVRSVQIYQQLASDLHGPYNGAARQPVKVPYLTPRTFSKRPRRPLEIVDVVAAS